MQKNFLCLQGKKNCAWSVTDWFTDFFFLPAIELSIEKVGGLCKSKRSEMLVLGDVLMQDEVFVSGLLCKQGFLKDKAVCSLIRRKTL